MEEEEKWRDGGVGEKWGEGGVAEYIAGIFFFSIIRALARCFLAVDGKYERQMLK